MAGKELKATEKTVLKHSREQKRIKNLDSDSYVYVKGDFEPIVSEELWHKCDEIRKSKVIKKENNGVVTTYGKSAPLSRKRPK